MICKCAIRHSQDSIRSGMVECRRLSGCKSQAISKIRKLSSGEQMEIQCYSFTSS